MSEVGGNDWTPQSSEFRYAAALQRIVQLEKELEMERASREPVDEHAAFEMELAQLREAREECETLRAERDRLDHLHKLDHSLCDQARAECETLRVKLAEKTSDYENSWRKQNEMITQLYQENNALREELKTYKAADDALRAGNMELTGAALSEVDSLRAECDALRTETARLTDLVKKREEQGFTLSKNMSEEIDSLRSEVERLKRELAMEKS